MARLRPYQSELADAGITCDCNALIQADTGAGKTRILASIAKASPYVLLVAHRNALISQLSLEFAKAGLYHRMIGADSTRRRAELLHRRIIGHSMLSPTANRFVCSIDTLLSQYKRNALTLDPSTNWLVIVDEAHHMIDANKWGKLLTMFPNCRVIGATATPTRLDGVLLKRGKGGVFDILLQAESLKHDSVAKLIQLGYLSPFKCYGIEPRIDINKLVLGRHDYTGQSLVSETRKHTQKMAGDAVKHYKRLADNKQAVAFCVSIDIANKTADSFRAAGVASASIHSKMSKTEVDKIFDLFQSKQIQVLCNVDMTGEGVDIPSIEVLIILRKTASFALYRQWVGRALRPCSGKEFAIIIDHADNVKKHGLPDRHVSWSLDSIPAEQKSNLITCKKCSALIKAWESICPECGTQLKSGTLNPKDIEYVDTNLVELYKTKIAKNNRDSLPAMTVDKGEIKNLFNHGSNIAKIETKVAIWFFESIKHSVTLGEVEEFLFKHNNIKFWSRHFTLAETEKLNKKKCLKVFNENNRRK